METTICPIRTFIVCCCPSFAASVAVAPNHVHVCLYWCLCVHNEMAIFIACACACACVYGNQHDAAAALCAARVHLAECVFV